MLLQRNISRVLCEWNKDNDVCILTAARSGHNMDNKQPKKKLLTTTKKIKTTMTCLKLHKMRTKITEQTSMARRGMAALHTPT